MLLLFVKFDVTITGNPNVVLANRKIRCIYAVLANKIMIFNFYLPLFLCLYESFRKGFESDQRRLTLLVNKHA